MHGFYQGNPPRPGLQLHQYNVLVGGNMVRSPRTQLWPRASVSVEPRGEALPLSLPGESCVCGFLHVGLDLQEAKTDPGAPPRRSCPQCQHLVFLPQLKTSVPTAAMVLQDPISRPAPPVGRSSQAEKAGLGYA